MIRCFDFDWMLHFKRRFVGHVRSPEKTTEVEGEFAELQEHVELEKKDHTARFCSSSFRKCRYDRIKNGIIFRHLRGL